MPLELKKKGNQALGRSRGGLSTKIHAAVEGLGNLATWILTAGNVHDSQQAEALLHKAVARNNTLTRIVSADKAYDSNAFVAVIHKMGAAAVIPQIENRHRKEPRNMDWYQYKARHLVEQFFCRLKQFRRVATRYDKLVSRYGAFVALAAAYVWLA